MAERAASILIVDDQSLYREGLKEIIGHWPEFKVVGGVSDGARAVRFCESSPPDIVLMDVRMPVMDGVEATRLITKAHPQIIVIMLTMGLDDQSLFGALSCGAKGYLLKNTPSRLLRGKLRGALRGEAAVSEAATTKMVEKLSRQPFNPASASNAGDGQGSLSEREIQIFRLVAQGLSNEEIAAQLYISPPTLKKQLRVLMQKYHFENRVQVAAYAIRSGISD